MHSGVRNWCASSALRRPIEARRSWRSRLSRSRCMSVMSSMRMHSVPLIASLTRFTRINLASLPRSVRYSSLDPRRRHSIGNTHWAFSARSGNSAAAAWLNPVTRPAANAIRPKGADANIEPSCASELARRCISSCRRECVCARSWRSSSTAWRNSSSCRASCSVDAANSAKACCSAWVDVGGLFTMDVAVKMWQ